MVRSTVINFVSEGLRSGTGSCKPLKYLFYFLRDNRKDPYKTYKKEHKIIVIKTLQWMCVSSKM